MTLNGVLAGLVAITAGCDAVSPIGAFIIGALAGVLVVFGIEFIDKVLKIDDPVGAIGVHGICGAFGTIATGLFALDGGLFYGGGAHFFIVQCIGVIAVIAWVAVTMSGVFTVIKHTVGLRVTTAEEMAGLDIVEHGLTSSYADFMPAAIAPISTGAIVSTPAVSMGEAIPVEMRTTLPSTSSSTHKDAKITKVDIVCNKTKFEDLKAAMNKIGVSGMTVTQVLGCGLQKGSTEYYRGVEMEMNLLPKLKVEIVICKVPVETVVETAKKALYTGQIGDGKIFVYDVENVIRIRTSDEGYVALQDEQE